MTSKRNRTMLLAAPRTTSTIAALCCILFIFLCTSPTSYFASGKVFTALADMEELLETEAVLIGNLDSYIIAQENKLGYLKKKLEEDKREHKDAAVEVTEYLSNPINAFLLTKRLTNDWKSVENVMSYDAGKVSCFDFHENIPNFRDELKSFAKESRVEQMQKYNYKTLVALILCAGDSMEYNTGNVINAELNNVKSAKRKFKGDDGWP